MDLNRRQFFKGLALTGAVAALWTPTKTIFLPPNGGWHQYKLPAGYMREIEQYLINTDSIAWRYDAVGRDIWGKEHQFHVDVNSPMPGLASIVIEDRFRHDGLRAIAPMSGNLRLVFPNCTVRARYV